jgi:hypothetical protein
MIDAAVGEEAAEDHPAEYMQGAHKASARCSCTLRSRRGTSSARLKGSRSLF